MSSPPFWLEDDIDGDTTYPLRRSGKADTDSEGSLNFTQQMRFATLRDRHPEAYPAGSPPAGIQEMHPTCLTLTEQLDMQLVADARRARLSGSNTSTDSEATHASRTSGGTTHVSQTDSGTTHVSQTDSGTTHVSQTDSGTTHVSQTDSETTHVSRTESDTSHVSPTDSEENGMDVTEPMPTSSALASLTSHALQESLHCEHVLTDGGVLWKHPTQGRLASSLAAVRAEEGVLLLVFYAHLKGHLIKVLVDSGASDNFVSESCAKNCGLKIRKGPAMRVTLADGSVKTSGEIAHAKFLAHTASGVDYVENHMALRVLPLGIQVDVVLGGKWLRSLSPVTLDYDDHGSISFDTRAKGGGRQRVKLQGCSPGVVQGNKARGAALIDEVFLSTVQLKRHLIALETARQLGDEDSLPQWLMMATRGDSEENAYAAIADELPYPVVDHDDSGKPTTGTVKAEDPDSRDAKVPPEWKKRFEAFFTEYEEQLRASLPELSKLRNAKEDNAHVTLKPDKEGGPPCRRPYKMSVEELRQLRERIEQLMEKGYIRPSSSPYAAPCLMVPKPGDPKTLRLVVDYRQLNQQTVRDRYPLPDIQLMFDEMQGAAFFSSFDAVDGFWQVPMAEEDVEKTAFTTQMGAYEWLVMPQGLQNSPSQYQRRMQRALGHLPFVRIFIDDCVVFSRTVEEHHEHCRIFL